MLNSSPFAEDKKTEQCEWKARNQAQQEFATLVLNAIAFMAKCFTISIHWSHLISIEKDGEGLDKQGSVDTKLSLGIKKHTPWWRNYWSWTQLMDYWWNSWWIQEFLMDHLKVSSWICHKSMSCKYNFPHTHT